MPIPEAITMATLRGTGSSLELLPKTDRPLLGTRPTARLKLHASPRTPTAQARQAPATTCTPPHAAPNRRPPAANVPGPPAARGHLLAVGSHVLQHLEHGDPALPSAESPGGLGSPPRPARHNPGSGGEAAAVGPPGATPRPSGHPGSPLRYLSESSGSLARLADGRQQENGGGLGSGGRAEGGKDSSNVKPIPDPRHSRQYSPRPVCRGSLLQPGSPGTDEVPFRPRMEADEQEKCFREPPPPSLKSS